MSLVDSLQQLAINLLAQQVLHKWFTLLNTCCQAVNAAPTKARVQWWHILLWAKGSVCSLQQPTCLPDDPSTTEYHMQASHCYT